MNKNNLRYTSLVLVALIAIALLIGIWVDFNRSFSLVFGLSYLLFLPGYLWSLVIWQPGNIDIPERITFSVALSFMIVPMTILIVNKLGVQINTTNTFIEVTIVILLASLTYFYTKSNKKNSKKLSISYHE